MEYANETCASAQRGVMGGLPIGGRPGAVNQVQPETELSSLLNTLSQQAHEVRALVSNILARVYPQAEEESAEKQVFSSGYVGTVEQVRSTQRGAIDLLHQLAKLV